MTTNLSTQLDNLEADELTEINYETGLSRTDTVETSSFAHYLHGATGNIYTFGKGASVSIGFYSDSPNYNFTSTEEDNAWQALQLWSGLTDITFTYAGASNVNSTTKAEVNFVHAFDTYGTTVLGEGTQYSEDSSYASGVTGVRFTATGHIQIDNTTLANDASGNPVLGSLAYGDIGSYTADNGYGIDTLVHEIGHLVGLGHTGPYNGSVDPTTQQFGEYDTRTWSIMSYIQPGSTSQNAAGMQVTPQYLSSYTITSDFGDEAPFTPMGLDIIGAQRIEGAPTSTMFSGHNTFGFNSNIMYTDLSGNQQLLSMYNFNIDTLPIVTLYDYGTNNTLDLSLFKMGQTIDLNDGTFSSVAGLINNVFIEWGTQIDRLIGGSGDDVITLNARADFVDGGGGNNTAVFLAVRSAYVLGINGSDVILTLASTGIAYDLRNIQTFKFADGVASLANLARANFSGAADNYFGVAANWDNDKVPDAVSAVSIGGGFDVVVTSQETNEVDSLTLSNGALLDITSGHFVVHDVLSSSTNAGSITVEAGSTLYLSGTLIQTDTGTLSLIGGGVGSAQLITDGPIETLAGTGAVIMDAGGVIGGRAPGGTGFDTVMNEGLIEGAGTIGQAGFAYQINFVNAAGAGVLANGPGALTLSAPTVNDGLLLAGGGTLDITGPVDQTAGGQIAAVGSGSRVLLDGGAITGGELATSNDGVIEVVSDTTLIGSLRLDGTIVVDAGATLTLQGDIVSTGLIDATNGRLDLSGAQLHGGAIKGSGGTQQLTGSGATLDGAQSSVTTYGVVQVGPNQTLTLRGSIANLGTIGLDGDAAAGVATLLVSGPVTLSGGGAIDLLDTYNGTYSTVAVITGNTGTGALDNIDDTITGYGLLGNGLLTLVNEASGVIIAAGNTLTLDTGANIIVNHGLMQGMTGDLVLDSVVANDGHINAGSGGSLTLTTVLTNDQSVTIGTDGTLYLAGGTITGSNNPQAVFDVATQGAVEVTTRGVIDGTHQVVELEGTVDVDAGALLTLAGVIQNSGILRIDGNAGIAHAVVQASGHVVLAGGGLVELQDLYDGSYTTVAIIEGFGTNDALENLDDSIVGYGIIGGASLTLLNRIGGSITASANTLTLDTGTNTIVNVGQLVAAQGDLVIDSTVLDIGLVVAQALGTVVLNASVTGVGAVVATDYGRIELNGSALASSLYVHSTAHGLIEAAGVGAIDGSQQASLLQGTTKVDAGAVLTLTGAIDNQGAIAVGGNAGIASAKLRIAGTATLSGGGTLTLADLYNGSYTTVAIVTGSSAADLLDNATDTIQGYGLLGNGALSFTNETSAIVSASANTLTVRTAATRNAGILQAVAGATLIIEAAVDSTGGDILAAGGTVQLGGDGIAASVTSGNLGGSGLFRVDTAGAMLNGVTNAAVIAVEPGSTLTVEGLLKNTGSVELDGNASIAAATLHIAGKVTLSGGGTIVLRDVYDGTYSGEGVIAGSTTADLLDNIDNTIAGYGVLGAGTLSFTNESAGVVSATANNLTVRAATRNAGSLQAQAGATLVIESAVENTGGAILADGGVVQLGGDGIAASIVSGTLGGTGSVRVDGAGATLDATISSAAIAVAAGDVLTVKHSLQNSGSIDLDGDASIAVATLHVTGTTTLSGGGTINLRDVYDGTYSTEAVITGSTTADLLDNIDDTIRGYGEIGAGTLTLVNEQGGTIVADHGTLVIDTGSRTVQNAGLLQAVSGTLEIDSAIQNSGEIRLAAGTVNAAALGNVGLLDGSGTVSVTVGNTGTIEAAGGTLTLLGMAAGALVVDAGSTLDLAGGIQSGASVSFGGAGAVLQIDGAAVPEVSVYGFGPSDAIHLTGVAEDPGGSVTVQPGNRLDLVQNGATYAVQLDPAQSFSGESFRAASASDGSLLLTIAQTGPLSVPRGSRLVIDGGAAATNAPISVTAGNGVAALQIDGMVMPTNVITGLATGDFINLADVPFDPMGTAVLGAGNILQITEGGHTYTLALDPNQSFLGETFTLSDPVGTDVTVTSAACYVRGTSIATAAGETRVEDLCIGDTVLTASGASRAIRWIGWRSYGGRFLAANRQVWPIRFQVGSLADGVPHRDLLVSPEHAMWLDGLLVPARCLVNDGTIIQEARWDRVDYFHIELETHDVLLAEGAWSESFLDDSSRGIFHNAVEFAELYPDAADHGRFCAPRVDSGAELEAIRTRLADAGRGRRAA